MATLNLMIYNIITRRRMDCERNISSPLRIKNNILLCELQSLHFQKLKTEIFGVDERT